MLTFTKEEWAKKQYTGQWGDNSYNQSRVETGESSAYYIGRRNLMVGGPNGCELLTEGLHFLIEGDYSNLPVLHKSNAIVGAAYQGPGNDHFILKRIYRVSEEYAHEHQLICLERVETSFADFALPGGDMRSDLRGGLNNA